MIFNGANPFVLEIGRRVSCEIFCSVATGMERTSAQSTARCHCPPPRRLRPAHRTWQLTVGEFQTHPPGSHDQCERGLKLHLPRSRFLGGSSGRGASSRVVCSLKGCAAAGALPLAAARRRSALQWATDTTSLRQRPGFL